MRKINVAEFISLDGVIEKPGTTEEERSGKFGPPDWIMRHADEMSVAWVQKGMHKTFDFLLGRITFQDWEKFWPQNAHMWPAVNTATKYVASNTLTSSPWQPTVFLSGGDVADKIARLKQTDGPDLHVAGSAKLVQTLLKHDLIDSFSLMIFPITLGGDKKLFAEGTIPAAFKVTESVINTKGVIMVNYERSGGALPAESL
jgi:dihydrofolate reductase